MSPDPSLFKHLVRHGTATRNPIVDVARPNINREEGSTLAFSKAQARKLLDGPAEDTLAGLRDRAILSIGLQVGLRRAEIAALTVGDLYQNRGFDALRLTRKGGRRDALAIHPRRRSVSGPISIELAMATIIRGRYFGHCGAMPRHMILLGGSIPTQSTGW